MFAFHLVEMAVSFEQESAFRIPASFPSFLSQWLKEAMSGAGSSKAFIALCSLEETGTSEEVGHVSGTFSAGVAKLKRTTTCRKRTPTLSGCMYTSWSVSRLVKLSRELYT